MAGIERFEDIEAWQKARELTRQIYQISNEGVFKRDFGLRDQIRRAAVSIMSNIAEGFERGGNREFQQFLAVAKGSAGEVRAQLYVAKDAGHVTESVFHDLLKLVSHVSNLIGAFIRYLKNCALKGAKYRPTQFEQSEHSDNIEH